MTINIKTATMSELVAFYNKHAEKPVVKFADKATAVKRCAAFVKKPKAKTTVKAKVGSTVVVSELKGSKHIHATEYHSTKEAFVELGLPLGTHKRFRKFLKIEGVRVYETEDKKFEFQVAA